MQEYSAWCRARSLSAFPTSYSSVAGYLTEKVASLGGSAKSIPNVVSSLRVYSLQSSLPWMTARDEYLLNRVRRQLDLEDTAGVERKHPVVLGMIQDALQKFWKPRESDYDLLCATAVLVGHNGLLRGGELLSGIQAKHVTWEPRNKSVCLHLPPTKTMRRGVGVDVRITDYAGPSAYKFLKEWFRRAHLSTHPERYVFPHYDARARVFNHERPAGERWLRATVKSLAAKLGKDPGMYSGHSLRAGGATDLFIMRVPYPQIKKYGRWVSDAAMVYYRDDIEVSATVADAFGSGVRKRPRTREYESVGVR